MSAQSLRSSSMINTLEGVALLEGLQCRRAHFRLRGVNGQLGESTGGVGVGQAIQVFRQAEMNLTVFVTKHLHE